MASSDQSSSKPGEFWSSTSNGPSAKPGSKPPMSRWKKILLFGGGSLVLIVLILLALVPTIAGFMAPGIVEKAAGEKVAGGVKVGAISLSWFGEQKIGPIVITDPTKPDGKNEVLRADVETSSGLLSLVKGAISGGPNLGTVKITGKSNVVRSADGTTNLQRALAPKKGTEQPPASKSASTSKPADAAKIPAGAQGRVLIENFDLNYSDEANPSASVQLKDLSVDATLLPAGSSVGASASVKVTTKALAQGQQGQIKVDATLDQFTDAAGVLKPDSAKVNATIQTDNLPTALVDALANMGGKLTAGLGPTLAFNVNAKGTMKSADATVKASAQGMNADASVKVADNVLTSSAPIMLSLTGNAVHAIAGLEAMLAKAGTLTLDRTPDVAFSIDNLKVRVPTGGAALDLRGASANIAIKTSAASGMVKLQLEPNAAPTAFSVSPLEFLIAAPDLAQTVIITGNTIATIGGKPAGTLAINLKAAGLLDAAGKLVGGIPGMLEGSANLTGVATAIAQPFVAGLKLDLPNDVGPTLDMQLNASTGAPNAEAIASTTGGNGPRVLGNVNLDITIKSAKVNANGAFELAAGTLKSRGPGFTLTADAAGVMASRFVAPDTGWALASRGKAVITAKDIVVPFQAGGYSVPLLDKASLKADVSLQGIAVTSNKPSKSSAPVDVSSLNLAAILTPGSAPNVFVNSAMVFEGQQFGLAGAFELRGLLAAGPNGTTAITPANARPVGSLELTNLPTSVMKIVQGSWSQGQTATRLAMLDGSRGIEPPSISDVSLVAQALAQNTQPAAAHQPDLGRVLADAVGPTVGLKLTTSAATEKDPLDISLLLTGAQLRSETNAKFGKASLDLTKCDTQLTLSPQGFETSLAQFAPQITPRPRLDAASKVLLTISPLSVPFKDGTLTPDLAKLASATIRVAIPDQLLIQGLTQKNADGTTKALGSIGIDKFEMNAGVPLAAAMPATAKWMQPFTLTLASLVNQGASKPILKLNVQGNGQLTGAPNVAAGLESAQITTKVTDIVNQNVESFLVMPDLLTSALGTGITLDSTTTLRSFSDSKARTIQLNATLNSPLLKMAEPLSIAMLPDRVRSDRPVKMTWQLNPEFANKYLFKPNSDGKPGMQLSKPTPVDVNLSRFTVSSGDNTGPLKPGIFDLALSAAVGALELTLPDGAKSSLNGTNLVLNSEQGGAAINFDIGVNEVTYSAGGAPPAAKKLTFKGNVSRLADANGNIQAKNAVVTANGDMPVIPTALLDALAKQDGLLVDALGPVAAATLRADNFGANGGTIDLNATSERASAQIRGSVADGVFISSEPIRMSFTEITTQLAARFIKGLPLIGSVQKNKTDTPALITADAMRVSLDNDLRKLNGIINIDPGQAKFETGKEFAGILKAINQKTSGSIGQKIDPIKATITNGIMKYERWSLPVGEFKLRTEGTVDLVNGTVDVLTYLPLGALTDEAAGLFKKGKGALGGLGNILGGGDKGANLEDTLMVPWRTRGPYGKTRTEPDLELFAKNIIKDLNPEDLLQKGLDELLKEKPKNK